MKTETLTLPAFWAPALVNGDESSLTPQELDTLDAWLTDNAHLGACLSCSDTAQLTRYHDATDHIRLACGCLKYTFPVISD